MKLWAYQNKLLHSALCVIVKGKLIMKNLTLIIVGLMLTSCSEILILSSGASVAVSHNAYVKAYNGVDMLTIMQTDKGIKQHAYERMKHETEKFKSDE